MRRHKSEYFLLWLFITIVNFAALRAPFDYQMGVVCVSVIVLVIFPFVSKLSSLPTDRVWLYRSLLVRLVVVLTIGLWVEEYYRVRTGLDADTYHRAGKEIVNLFRMGIFPELSSRERWSGTVHYILQTGFFYWIFYPSAQLIKVINTFVAFLGTLGFYRVYRRLKPQGAVDLPLLLLLLMPSLIFWTSIHGKDPWMYSFLGMATFFITRFLWKLRPWDFLGFALGVLGLAWIRPHMAVIFSLSVATLPLFYRYRHGLLSPLRRVVTLIPIIAVVYLSLKYFKESFGVATPEEMLAFAAYRGMVSAFGGSAIHIPEIRSFGHLLMYYPWGLITVLFRPFLWEASSPFGIISAFENLVLFIFSLQYLWQHGLIPKHPIGKMAGIYVLLFVLAFYPASGNLGTLVRQKVQLLPFWLIYLGSLPDKKRQKKVTRTLSPLGTKELAPL